MTYTQAKMIVWNPDSYDRENVRKACSYILGSTNARQEDIDAATNVIAFC